MVRDIATCLYYTGIDPFTKKEVHVAKGIKDRKMQRALMQFFKPENWFTVREALIEAGRQDLIGNGCDCLIPAQPLKEAIEARRHRANDPRSPTRPRARSPGSGACRTRATGPGGRRRNGVRRTAAVQAHGLSHDYPWRTAQAPATRKGLQFGGRR